MATKSSTPVRKAGRSLAWLGAIIVVLAGIIGGGVLWAGWSPTPKLALDLEGGTQIILEPIVVNGQDPSTEQLTQAVSIIRQRVDYAGTSEAEIGLLGKNIVVSIPGIPDQATLDRIQAASKLEFRPVLLAGQPSNSSIGATPSPTDSASPSPTDTAAPTASATPDPGSTPSIAPTDDSDLNWVTPNLQAQYDSFDCSTLVSAETNAADPELPLVTCQSNSTVKYLLGPVEVSGETISNATAGTVQGSSGVTTNTWAVNIVFDGTGTTQFATVTERLNKLRLANASPRDQFAIVLDGRVISAPVTRVAIVDGKPQITGNFTQATATELANQLKFGALPLSFTVQSRDTIDSTLGKSQLVSGIVAGGIGLLLVVLYSFFQYRALASVTISSLVIAAAITYGVITIAAQHYNYRLSLAGVAGLIVAIGFTVDSFIVYFERIRDELRDGRGLVGAVEAGWKRALRTIYAAKGVTMLSAIVLYIFAVGNVRGFALTLGITVIIDVLVVVLFTHPMLQLLATTRFFSSGNPLSGLDPDALGAVYRGRAEFRTSADARRGGASREAGIRQTIAERKAAESEGKK